MNEQLIELEQLSDDDAVYIAKWMAEAFAASDPMAEILTGVKYKNNPTLHERFYEGYLTRNNMCGTLVVSKDRDAVVTRFRPGEIGRSFDFSLRTGKDEAWDAFIEQSGGQAAILKRWSRVTEALQEHTSRYGSELGVQHYHLSLLAVHPRKQGQGLGRQLFTYVSQEAAAQDALLWFRCSNNNVPFYERLGAVTVGLPTFAIDGLGIEFPEGAGYGRSMEWRAPSKITV